MIEIKDNNERKNNWSLLVKPTEACNLDCQYCYAKPFRDKYGNTKMDFALLEKILTLAENHAKNVSWIWHGGEPTLMGVEWYKTVQELFYKHDKTTFSQSMQSNGVLLNAEWAKLQKEYNIDIGVSYDVFDQNIRSGSQMINIENNIKKFIEAGGNCGTISVINKSNYKRQIELYEYFKNDLRVTPAFNHVYRSGGTLSFGLEIPAQQYVDEFLKYYKHWLSDTSEKAIIERSVSTMTKQIIGNRDLVCTSSDCRHCWIGVNCVGDLYPCDRYVPEKYSMGNIKDFNSIKEIYDTPGHKLYSLEIQKRFLTHCKECGYFDYCKGGCNANHIANTGNAYSIDTFSCELFRLKYFGVYNVLREVDLYSKKYNKYFYTLAIVQPFFTVNEIFEFLKYKNIDIPKESLTVDNLLKSKEFRLFRVFNQFKGDINKHCNYIDVKLDVDIQIGADFDMNSIKSERFEAMEKIYIMTKNHINDILKE